MAPIHDSFEGTSSTLTAPIPPPEAEAPLTADADVQAQVALRLTAGLIDHLTAAGVLTRHDGARIAEQAAAQAERGPHSLRHEIAVALRRIIVR
jgi:hypothetical protein